MKFIFVTGGVLSGLGKGILAASIGNIMKARGYKVFMQKLDPYINYDAGTLNPGEHGEVFVTDDGAEADLDLGHYERFTDENMSQNSSVMTGRVYGNVIAKEREGKYLGKTVQVIPHVTGSIKELIIDGARNAQADIAVVEVGGTVGDYEAFHFLEAIRQLRHDLGPNSVMYCHLVFLPYLGASKEIKTRPAQYSVRELQSTGITPDAVFCRSDFPVEEHHLAKIASAASLPISNVFPMPTAKSVYQVPLAVENHGLGRVIESRLALDPRTPNLADWESLVRSIQQDKPTITIGIVAKYTTMEDTYICVFEALRAAGWAQGHDIRIKWIDAENLEQADDLRPFFAECAGVVVPGGFGSRGIEGKIKAAQYARENNLPYLGLCLGMQIAVIEYARNVLGLVGANSTEFDPNTPHPVIHIMEHQKSISSKGGTMRLGAYPALLTEGSMVAQAYGTTTISERHRHRYEFNNDYRTNFAQSAMQLAGVSPDGSLVEVIELRDHPWYVASQYHPEFKSRPNRPHPLFSGLVRASLVNAEKSAPAATI